MRQACRGWLKNLKVSRQSYKVENATKSAGQAVSYALSKGVSAGHSKPPGTPGANLDGLKIALGTMFDPYNKSGWRPKSRLQLKQEQREAHVELYDAQSLLVHLLQVCGLVDNPPMVPGLVVLVGAPPAPATDNKPPWQG